MRNHVRQLEDNECGVAAYATVVEISLDESRQAWEPYRTQPNGWIKHTDMRDRLIEAEYLKPNCSYSTNFDPAKGDAIIYCRNAENSTSGNKNTDKKSQDDNGSEWRHYIPFIGGLYYDPHSSTPSRSLKPNLIPSIVYYLDI